MLTLYYKPTCPYCQRVLGEAETFGLKLNLKDITAEASTAEELIEKGGKRQVPYLVDDERGVAMYESGDIVAYINEHYASAEETSQTFNGLKIHKSEDSCDVCE